MIKYINFLSFLLIFIGTIYIINIDEAHREEAAIQMQFIIIIFISLFFLIYHGGLLFKIYFTFSFFFFGVIPYIEYIHIVTYWYFPPITDDTYFKVNSLLITLNVLFIIIYNLGRTKTTQKVLIQKFNENIPDPFWILFFISFSAFLLVFHFNNYSAINMLVRGSLEEKVVVNGSVRLIIDTTIRSIPAIIFFLYSLTFRNKHLKKLLLFLLLLASVFPTGVARYLAAAIYVPVLLITFPSFAKGTKLAYSIVLSLLVVFPFIDQFRNYKPGDKIHLFGDLNFLLGGHFDSYQSIGQTIQSDFVTWGYQLLGNLFFFIPRVFWPEKPIGTGHTLANLYNLPFTNISANYYAEGYANFGILGMFIFCIILALICGKMDKLYNSLSGYQLPFFTTLYYIFAGYLIYLLRGDLLSSISYLIGILISLKMIDFIFNLNERIIFQQP